MNCVFIHVFTHSSEKSWISIYVPWTVIQNRLICAELRQWTHNVHTTVILDLGYLAMADHFITLIEIIEKTKYSNVLFLFNLLPNMSVTNKVFVTSVLILHGKAQQGFSPTGVIQSLTYLKCLSNEKTRKLFRLFEITGPINTTSSPFAQLIGQ